MQLTRSGTVKIDGHNARFTNEGKWLVSRHETFIGEVDTLEEVSGLIARHLERVRARLARAQERHRERQAERLLEE